MSTSNITGYESTAATIINNAFGHIRVTQKGQPLQADDFEKGKVLLNGIIKNWQHDGLHLWKDREAVVFLEIGRKVYSVGETPLLACDDGCKADDVLGQGVYSTHGDWVNTATTAAYTTADDVINVASLTGYSGIAFNTSCAMNIGIENVNGTRDWYTITGVDAVTNDITLNIALVNDVPEAATVFIYRESEQLEKPLKIYQENVRLYQCDSNYELPLYMLAWSDYNLLPQKDSSGIPVQAFYSPRINNTDVAIWPTSNSVRNVLMFRYQAPFDIFDSDTDTQDFPSEWIRPLEWALAAELGPSYGLRLDRQAYLDSRASMLKDQVLDWDQDNSSLYIYPRSWG